MTAPAAPFVVDAGGEAHGRAAVEAAAAALPAPAGPFVPIVGEPTLPTIVAILSAFRHRVPALLVHPRLTPPERAALLDDAARHTPAADTAAILYTSGTTGRPRGAQLSHAALAAAAAASATRVPFGPGDRWLCALPLAHVGGLSIITRALAAGATVVLGVLDRALASATHVSLVPTQLARLLESSPPPPPSLRTVLLGGAAAPAALLARAAALGWPVQPTYGLTEACSQVATVDFADRFSPAGHGAGRPLPGVDLRCSPDGHILVRGPALFSGYLGAPPRAAGDFHDTGDLGELDAAGNLHVHARRTDLIVTGGENVYPAEVEDALTSLPGVSAALVFAVPDPLWGQRVAALLVAAAPPDPAALAARLAPHKRPRLISLVTALPLTPAGKLDRAAAPALAARAGLVPI